MGRILAQFRTNRCKARIGGKKAGFAGNRGEGGSMASCRSNLRKSSILVNGIITSSSTMSSYLFTFSKIAASSKVNIQQGSLLLTKPLILATKIRHLRDQGSVMLPRWRIWIGFLALFSLAPAV